MLRFASSTLPVSTRSLIRSGFAAAVACVASLAAMAQGELVFVHQPVAQQSGYVQDITFAADGGAYTMERYGSQNSTLLSKLRRDGSVEWNLTIPNVRLNVLDTDGAGLISAGGESNGDAVVLRLAPDGSELWRATLPSNSEQTACIDALDSGEVFLGWREQPSGCPSTFISRISASGSIAWSRAVNCNGELRVAAAPSGDLYYLVSNYQVGRLTANGQTAWEFGLSSQFAYVNDVAVDAQGAAVYCGRAQSNSTFGSPIGGDDAFIFRVLPGGAINWVRRFGTPYNDDARFLLTNGSTYTIAGETEGRFGGPPAGWRDVWLCEIDAFGNMAWSNQIGSPQHDWVRSIAPDALGGTFILGEGGSIPASGSTTGGQWIARFGYFDCFTDADGDTFGEDGDILLSATACSNGLSFLDTDCDDTRAYVYPGAAELCDGLDNDCDGTIDEGFISTYCTSGTSTNGCAATMSSQGTPSTTAGSGFQVICSNVEGRRYGLILYGTNPGGALWAINGTSYICVAPPQGRTDSQTSGGTLGACDGTLSLDFNLYLATHPNSVGAPYSPGQYLYAQGWYRDPAAPKGTNLSDGIQFALCN